MNCPALVFVYNADSGMFNTLADIAHKLISPHTYQCKLCAISHGYFSEHDEWKKFINSLEADCEFLHRDELATQYGITDVELPAVFLKSGNDLQICLDADIINGCQQIADIKTQLLARCLQGTV